jgi:hypothetical protein
MEPKDMTPEERAAFIAQLRREAAALALETAALSRNGAPGCTRRAVPGGTMQLTDAERASRKVASAIYPYLLGEESDLWVVHFLKWAIRSSTNPIDELAEAWWWAEHAEQFEAEEEELRAQYGDPLMHIDVLKAAETALLTAQGEEPCD